MEKKRLTMDSRVKDVWENPVGHDILAKILMQLGMREKVITNPFVSAIKLKKLVKPASKILDEGFWPAFLKLVNSEEDRPGDGKGEIHPAWWKEAVFYQIYPRSFTKEGLQGIRSKLDHLQQLGVDALWLSPIYDSPMDDNGYDIRDYRKIAPMFGTMADFDALLEDVHGRHMKLIMDLVVNHTSDEHACFQSAIEDPESPYRNWYFIRQDEGHVPNNWTSFFSGRAWDQYGENKDWALHLFSKKQVDLNWDEPAVRKAVSDMVNWWLAKGVDGFRLDVINYISKDPGLPDGDVSVGKLMGFTGIDHYYYGPNLHTYLHELHENSFAKYNAFSIGETPGLGMEMAKLITGEERQELDMIFSFDHLETPGHTRFEDYRYDLNYFRDYIMDWTTNYGNNCWMSLFYNNHDNPRMVSKIDPSGTYRQEICTLLAVMQFTLKGTPFVYQGDEMGLANIDFANMDAIHDVESKGMYAQLIQEGKTEEEAFAIVKAGTRDHARALLPWCGNAYGQVDDPIIEEVYRFLIQLRHREKALVYGDFKVLDQHKDRFVYERTLGEDDFVIDCNLSEKSCKAWYMDHTWMLVWPHQLEDAKLPPYGARIWKKIKDQ